MTSDCILPELGKPEPNNVAVLIIWQLIWNIGFDIYSNSLGKG